MRCARVVLLLLACLLVACNPSGKSAGPTEGEVELTVQVVGKGKVSAGSDTCGADSSCPWSLTQDKTATLSEVPQAGWHFVGWSSGAKDLGTTASLDLLVDISESGKVITATFAPDAADGGSDTTAYTGGPDAGSADTTAAAPDVPSKAPGTLIETADPEIDVGVDESEDVPLSPAMGCDAPEIDLVAQNLPQGVTFTATPIVGCAGGSLQIHASAQAKPGTSVITLVATSATKTQSLPVTLVVGLPAIALTLNAPAALLQPGGTATVPFGLARTFGAAGPVDVTADGLPAGVTATPLTVAAKDQSGQLLLTASFAAALAGPVQATVHAKSGNLTASAPLAVSVAPPPSGGLDASYGSGGRTVVDVAKGSTDAATSAALLPDGRLAIGGTTQAVGANLAQALILVLGSDGKPDKSFAGSGSVTFKTANSGETLRALLVSSAHLLAIGSGTDTSNGVSSYFAVTAWHFDGTPDTAFANSGVLKWNPIGTAGYDSAWTGAVQGDGKLVVAGQSTGGNSNPVPVARFLADGSGLDPSFGSKGQTLLKFGGTQDRALAMAIDSDGKILLAGDMATASFLSQVVVARLNADGTPDATFGSGGILVAPSLGTNSYGFGLAILGDHSALVGGSCNVGGYLGLVARFSAAGALDAGFGSGGSVMTGFSTKNWEPSAFHALAMQADGKVVVAGSSTLAGQTSVLVARLAQKDGSLDATFQGPSGAGAGKFTVPAAGKDDRAVALLLQADGSLLVVGTTIGGDAGDLFALRLLK